MAKSGPKTNSLGMNLDPESFKEVAARNEAPEVEPEKTPVKENEVEKKVEVPIEEPEQPTEAQKPANILAGLKSSKPAAKSYAFYLSDGNVKKLKALAKKQGVSASKLLDHILSEVLK